MTFHSPRLKRLLYTTALSMLTVLTGQTALANPLDGNVVAGSATIGASGPNLDIIQHSDRAVIDWRSFNIGVDEHTRFYQPNSNAIVVNRINDVNPSQILGKLSANGNVVLINPNGVFFGNGAVVDVNGMLATTAGIDNDKFMNGSLHFDKAGNPDASIINEGHITAQDAGLIGLVAPNVLNRGVIEAKLGRVELASGDTVTVDFRGNGLTEIAVSDKVKSQLISNTGTIKAAGGTIAVTAAAGKDIVNNLIEIKGELKAPAVSNKNGKIQIFAAGSNAVAGNVTASKGVKTGSSKIVVDAKIDVSGKSAGEKGGSVQILGDHIQIKSGTVIDASGDTGGGDIKIGGDYKGEGTTATALTTKIDAGSKILNNAITSGNGGRTIIWSDDTTEFRGDIEAKGGSQSGNGGFVETSGKKDLTVTGHLDLSAAKGGFGTWLLDPTNITIYNRSQAGTDNVNTVTTSYLESQNANISLVADNSINIDLTGDTLLLGSGKDLTLTATNGSIVSVSAGTITTQGTGSITLNAGASISFVHDLDLNATGTGSITLRANTHISYSASGDITTNGGAITLNSDRDANGTGNIGLAAGTQLISNGGNITLGGGIDPTTGFATGTSTSQTGIFLVDSGTGTTSPVINAGGGNIILNGQGWLDAAATGAARGVVLKGATVTTIGTGSITINGKGGGTSTTTTNNNHGVFIYNSTDNVTPTVSAVNGTISITGQSVEASTTPSGALALGGSITTTGTGNIVLTANNVGSALGRLSSSAVITSGGNLTYIGDTLTTIAGTMTAAGDIILRPNTAGTTIGIGSGAGTFSLTDSSLGKLVWGGTLWVGGYGLTGAEAGFANNAGAITYNSTRTFTSNVAFSSAASITLSSAFNASGTSNVTLNSSTGVLTTAAITIGSGNLNMIADSIAWGGNISGTGNFWLQPYSSNRALHINGGGTTGVLYLVGTDVGRLQNTWNSLTFGNSSLSNLLLVGGANWASNVSFVTGTADIRFTSAGSTLAANKSFTATTSGGDISAYYGIGYINVSGTGAITLSSGRDILVPYDFDLNSATGTIRLNANRDIKITASGDISTTGGSIILNSDRDATGGGLVSLGGGTILASNGGNITIGGGSNPALNNAQSVQGAAGVSLSGATINASGTSVGGDIIINGQGWQDASCNNNCYGVSVGSTSTVITSGNGSIKISTVSGGTGTTTYVHGLRVHFSTITAVNGDITLSGEEISTHGSSRGISITSSTVQTTGTGNINLISKNASTTNGGLEAYQVMSTVTSGGNISLITNNLASSYAYLTLSAAGDIIIRPDAAGITVGVGSGASAFQITDAFIGSLTYGNTLWLGGYGLTGAETGYWNSAGNLTLNSAYSFAKNVNFLSGNNIVSGGAGTITLTNTASTILAALSNIQITHDLDFNATGTGNVTLRANEGISYTASGDITTTTGTITLNSNRDGINDGFISLASGTELRTSGGHIILGGGSAPATTNALGNASNFGHGISLSGATLNAGGGGTVSLRGTGTTTNGYGVYILSSAITSDSGNIRIDGTGQNPTNSQGIDVSSSSITSTSGNISLYGISTDGYGIVFWGNASIVSQSGDMYFEGNGTFGSGIYANNSTTKTIGSATSTGKISFVSNTVSGLQFMTTQTLGDIVIRPRDAGTTVGIGSGAGTLQITDSVFSKLIWGGSLWLGGYGLTGAETGYWNSAGDMTLNSAYSFAKNVNFLSAGNINSGAAGTITLTNAASAVFRTLSNFSITHDLDVTSTGTGNVTVQADGNIVYSGSGDITTNGGSVTLNSDRNADSNGAISLGVGTNIVTNGGNITLGGGINPTTTMAYGNTTYNMGINLNYAILNANGTSSGGNIVLNGQGSLNVAANGAYGVFLESSTVQTNFNGQIIGNGTGGGSGAATGSLNIGFFLRTNSVIQTVDGLISLTGTGGIGANGQHHGFALSTSGANKVQSLGSGNIVITGNSPSVLSTSYGMFMNSAAGGIFSTSGNISITGSGPSSSGAYLQTGTIGGSTATGNISITSGQSIGIANTISTNGNGGITVSSGSQISLNFGNAISTANGSISFTATNGIVLTGTTNILSTNGSIAFNNTVNGAFNLTASANTITSSGSWGNTNGLGNITLTTVNSISLSSITTAAGKTVNVTASGAGSVITASAISTGVDGNITLTSDDMALNGALSGTGTLTLQPYAIARTININRNTDNGTTLFLGAPEINLISDGWTMINIGRTDATTGTNLGLSTWKDPVSFRAPGTSYLDGAVTGTGDASFVFSGIVYARDGSITTAGQNVTLGTINFERGGSVTTNGGNLTISRVFISKYTLSAVSFSTNGGSITVSQTMNESLAVGAPVGKSVTFNAGTGTVLFSGSITGSYNLTANAGAITFGSTIGTSSVSLGTVTLTATNSITLPTTYAGNLTATVTGAANSITAGAISTGAAGNISLTADDMILNGNLSGTGTLLIQTNSSNRVLNINFGSADGTNLNLSTAEMARIVDGWSSIEFKNANPVGNIGTVTFNDPVTFYNGMRIYGTITGAGNSSFTSLDNIYSTNNAGSIITNGNAITLNKLSIYGAAGGNVDINSNNGTITIQNTISNYLGTAAGQILSMNAGTGSLVFNSTVNGGYNLTASAGSMTFNGAWGGIAALGDITLTSSNSLVLPSITTAAGKTVSATVTGASNTITTSVIATGTGGNITLTADDLILNGALSGTGIITLQPYSTTRTVNVARNTDNGTTFHLTAAEVNQIANGWSRINIGRSDATAYTNIGNTAWQDPVYFRNTSPTYLDGAISSSDDGHINFSGTNVFVRDGSITTAGQNVTFANGLAFERGGSITTNGGNVTVGGTTSIVGYTLGTVSITTNGGAIDLRNVGQSLYGGAVVGKTLALDAGAGTITFGASVTGAYNLTANANSIVFNTSWASSSIPLGTVSLTSVNSITMPTIYASTFNATVTGAGNKITTSAIATGTGGNITLTADDVNIGGNLSGTGSLVLRPNALNRTVNVNYGVDDGSNFNLSTAEIARLVDGWSGITISRTGTTVMMNINTSTWYDPVSFVGSQPGRNIYGTITGVGDASIIISGPNANHLYGSIVTNGQKVDLGGNFTSYNGSVTTNGGDLKIFNQIFGHNTSGDFTVNTSGGSIVIIGAISSNTDGRNITLNAGSGSINFGSTVNNGYNVTATAGSIVFNGAWGGLSALGNVTLTTTNSLSLPAITTLAGKSVNITSTGAGNVITASTISTGAAGNITLVADDLVLNGDLSGTGNIALRPYSTVRSINIATGTDNGASFHLSTADISRLVDGWNLITLSNGSNTINLGTSTWLDPVFFKDSYNITIVSGNVTGTGNASFLSNNVFLDNGFITTAGQNITVDQLTFRMGGTVNTNGGNLLVYNVIRTGNTDTAIINTSGGNLTATNGITTQGNAANKNYVFNAGTGTINLGGSVNTFANISLTAANIVLNGAWGNTTALGDVNLTATNSIVLPSITLTAGKTFNATVTGAGNQITASTIATGAGGNITLTADDLTLNDGLSGTGSITLQPYASTRSVVVNAGAADGTNFNLSSAEIGRLTDGWSNINIGRLNSTATTNIGTTAWTDSVNFRSNGTKYTSGDITLTDGASLVFTGHIDINKIITTNGGSVAVTGNLYGATGGIISTNGGAVNIGGLSTWNGGTGITINSSGGNINIGAISIGGTGAGTRDFILNSGTGTIAFNGTVNTNGNINATGNAITFGNTWGGTTPLGNVTLTSVNNIALPTITLASGKTLTATVTGAGNSITSSAITVGTGGNITLTADNLAVNGILSGTGNLVLKPYDTARAININSGANDGSNFNLSTAELANIASGWNSAAIGSLTQNGAITIGDATWNSAVRLLANNGNIILNGTQNAGNNTFLARTVGTGDVVIGTTGSVISIAADDAIVLASARNFINNNANASVLQADNGRWLVYSTNPYTNTRGNLMPNATALYDTNYAANAPATIGSGNRFLFSDAAGTAPTLTFTADNKSKVYGQGNEALTYTVTGYIGADTASNAYQGSASISTLIDNYSNVGANTDAITIGAGSLVTYLGYQMAFDNGNYAITPASLTITANSVTKTYGQVTSFTGNEFAYNGLLNNDTITHVDLSSLGAAGSANASTTPYAIEASNASGNGLSNYTITYVDGSLNVNKANLTIMGNNIVKDYGQEITLNSSHYIHGTLYNGDVISNIDITSAGAIATAGAAGSPYAVVLSNATGTGLSNYNIQYTNGSLTVNKANLTIAANNVLKSYGETYVFSGTGFTQAGLLNNDTITGLQMTSAGAAATANVSGSNYTIAASNASGTGLSNYNIIYVDGVLQVTPVALSVTANNIHKTYGNTYNFTNADFTTIGLKNNDAITNINLSSAGADNNVLAGTSHAITINGITGTGLSNYIITYNNGTMVVDKANLIISGPSYTKEFNTSLVLANTDFAASGLKNNDTVTSVTLNTNGAASAATAGQTYPIYVSNALGTGLSNYTITYNNGSIIIPDSKPIEPVVIIPKTVDFSSQIVKTVAISGKEFTNFEKSANSTESTQISMVIDGQVDTYKPVKLMNNLIEMDAELVQQINYKYIQN